MPTSTFTDLSDLTPYLFSANGYVFLIVLIV